MKINELKGKDLATLLTELFGLKGAKEIFARHNIEMVTYETEKQGLKQFLEQSKELFESSKAVKEYKQAVMFLDAQINNNKSILETAEGFMKTMIDGMIKGFETTKQVAVDSQSILFRKELKGLEDNILNAEDREKVSNYINEMTVDKFSAFKEKVNTIDLEINSRYEVKEEGKKQIENVEIDTEDKHVLKEHKEEPKKKVKEAEKPKEVEKSENAKTQDDKNIEEIEKELENLGEDFFDEAPDKSDTKAESPKEKPKQETENSIEKELMDLGLGDDEDFDDDDMDMSDFDEEDKELDLSDNEDIDPFI